MANIFFTRVCPVTSNVRNAAQIIQHPNWNQFFASDFCLIQVDTPFDLSNPNEAQPACLPTDCSTQKCIPGEDVLIVGLGSIYEDWDSLSKTLLKTYLVVMEESVCASRFANWNPTADRKFYAWIENQGMAAACAGVNGGPLFC